MKTLRALISAGLSDDQIRAVMSAKAVEPEPKAIEPEPKAIEPDIQQQMLTAIKGLTETIQASNIAGAKNKEPETIDDMLESLIKAD